MIVLETACPIKSKMLSEKAWFVDWLNVVVVVVVVVVDAIYDNDDDEQKASMSRAVGLSHRVQSASQTGCGAKQHSTAQHNLTSLGRVWCFLIRPTHHATTLSQFTLFRRSDKANYIGKAGSYDNLEAVSVRLGCDQYEGQGQVVECCSLLA